MESPTCNNRRLDSPTVLIKLLTRGDEAQFVMIVPVWDGIVALADQIYDCLLNLDRANIDYVALLAVAMRSIPWM